MRLTPPKIIKRLNGPAIWTMEQGQDVYLTFDDGPTPDITEWVLDALDRYDAKATFFCLGRNVERHPELLCEILKRGHKAGNHTYSHIKGWRTENEKYFEDVDFAEGFIGGGLFRPPYGQIKPSQVRELGKRYGVVMWDVLSRDYNNMLTPRQCTRNVTRHVRGGSIVVFHDSVKAARNLRYALPRVLEYIYETKGLKCSAIEL